MVGFFIKQFLPSRWSAGNVENPRRLFLSTIHCSLVSQCKEHTIVINSKKTGVTNFHFRKGKNGRWRHLVLELNWKKRHEGRRGRLQRPTKPQREIHSVLEAKINSRRFLRSSGMEDDADRSKERTNLDSLPSRIVRKSADQSVASTTYFLPPLRERTNETRLMEKMKTVTWNCRRSTEATNDSRIKNFNTGEMEKKAKSRKKIIKPKP